MNIILFAFLIVYIGVFVESFFLMKKANIDVLTFSVPSVVMISIFVFGYIGLLPMYVKINDYAARAQDEYIVLELLLIISYVIITMCLGFIFAKKILKLKIRPFTNSLRPINYKERIFLIFSILICLIMFIIYLKQVPEIALFTAIFKDSLSAQTARSLMTSDFSGNLSFYNIFKVIIIQLVSYIFFASWLKFNKKKDAVCFFVSFIIAAFASVVDTQKAPFVFYIISLFGVWCLTLKKGKIPIKKLFVLLSIVVLFALIPFYLFFMGSDSITTAFEGMFNRLFVGQLIPAYYYLKFFPSEISYLNGASFPNTFRVLPHTPFELSKVVMNKVRPELVDRGIVGSMPTTYWGEIYANEGLPGLLLIPFLVGICLYFIMYILSRMENTPMKIGCITILTMHYQNLAITGLYGFISDHKIIVIIGFCLILLFFSKLNFSFQKYKLDLILKNWLCNFRLKRDIKK